MLHSSNMFHLRNEMNLRAQEKNRQVREMQKASEAQITDITRETQSGPGLFSRLLGIFRKK